MKGGFNVAFGISDSISQRKVGMLQKEMVSETVCGTTIGAGLNSLDTEQNIVHNYDIGYAQSINIGGSSNTMSFAMIYACTDGVVVASDTRRTITKNNLVSFNDTEKKIFSVAETKIVGLAVGANRFGPYSTKSPVELVKECGSKTRITIADELSIAIDESPNRGGYCIALAEPSLSPSGGRCVRLTQITRNEPGEQELKQPAVITNASVPAGEAHFFGASPYIELATKFASEPVGVDEGSEIARRWVQFMIDLSSMIGGTNAVVGGEPDVIVSRL